MTTPRPPIDLRMVGIRVGDTLTFRGSTVTCIVTQLYPSEVRYKGQLMSLSAAAIEVLGVDASGPQHWEFEGQTLSERRDEFRAWHSR